MFSASRRIRRGMMFSLIALSLFAGGCASQSTSGGSEATRVISTAQGVYYVQGPRVTNYVPVGKTPCAECTKVAEKFALTGKLDPMCETCKSSRTLMTTGPRP